MSRHKRPGRAQLWLRLGFLFLLAPLAVAQGTTAYPPQFGPYNGEFLTGGIGLRFSVPDKVDTILAGDAAWTISCWYQPSSRIQSLKLLAGMGDVSSEYSRFLALAPGRLVLLSGVDQLSGPVRPSRPGEWHLVSATSTGSHLYLYSDGALVADGVLPAGAVSPVLQLAPAVFQPTQADHFGGRIAQFTILRHALTAAEVHHLAATPPAFENLFYEEGSKPWPLQTRAQAGNRAPQEPAQMPSSRAPFSAPISIKRPPRSSALVEMGSQRWGLFDNWDLRSATETAEPPEQLSSAAFDSRGWLRATVPGTVLTTLVDDGVYPDPYYGLNNLAIPETLNKHGYWYRNVFQTPVSLTSALRDGGHAELTFEGINYEAELWLNSKRIGRMKGAFQRGIFDVTGILNPGSANVLAVRIDPPPHPGIPHEQSILGGAGENGGSMELDGPTFLATEGWDWLPAIRDRDAGIWQPVTLSVTGQLHLGDVQVISRFAHHDLTRAALEVRVPITNLSNRRLSATLKIGLEALSLRKTFLAPPGVTMVLLTSAEFPQLSLDHPRLWWPNGYGKPELYNMAVTVEEADGGTQGIRSDTRQVRFGIREVGYELSLLDPAGTLRRVDFTPANAPEAQQPIVDVSHSGMRQIPSADAPALHIPEAARDEYPYQSVVSSLAPAGVNSSAIEASSDMKTAPYLVLKVNGVRIAARGGNWGMDDAMKRVSRERLEPYFRLHRDANMNIIRNWVGQNTEETFYALADEYGLMVWNDFWESTQNYNIEAEDPALFLANARDTIERFRNHPSIVLWCGRNEGVPQPILNTGLEELVRTLDGTRFYSPSSNQVNLQQSGPYSYQDPSLYFTTLNRGFSVETGTPSMSTLESFRSTVPEADQWPMSDTWAYHDWHFAGNGRVQPFMHELEVEFGGPTDLADFERKAQMLNYVDHRAIFEGMNAGLWSPNSGRMLWMTQPAWPSTMWQILSSDYDTHASFYGARKGSEPLHVQLNLSTYQVDVVNTTPQPRPGLLVSAKVVSLTNATLSQMQQRVDLPADDMAHTFTLPLKSLLQQNVALVELTIQESSGAEVSRNFYWLANASEDYRKLASLPPSRLDMQASATRDSQETVLTVALSNHGTAASLANKLTLLDREGSRILPAYYSDNFVSLLPGESQVISIRFPSRAETVAQISLRGWNAVSSIIPVKLPK